MSIFHSNWFQGSKKYRNALNIFITNAKKPIVIVSAKIFEVTLDSSVRVCQITYKFYALLQSLNYWTFFSDWISICSYINLMFKWRWESTEKKARILWCSLTLSLSCQSKNLHNTSNCFTLFCLLFLLLLEKSQSRAHCINHQRSGMTWKPRTHFL